MGSQSCCCGTVLGCWGPSPAGLLSWSSWELSSVSDPFRATNVEVKSDQAAATKDANLRFSVDFASAIACDLAVSPCSVYFRTQRRPCPLPVPRLHVSVSSPDQQCVAQCECRSATAGGVLSPLGVSIPPLSFGPSPSAPGSHRLRPRQVLAVRHRPMPPFHATVSCETA